MGSSPIKIFINGDLKKFPQETNIVSVLEFLNISSKHIAIEINENLVFRSDWQETNLKDGDKVEIVKAIGGGLLTQDSLVVAGKNYSSRLLVGTGKYKDEAEAIASIEASGAEIVTVAVRRIDLKNDKDSSILDYISPDIYTILPNTAGAYSTKDAVRMAKLVERFWVVKTY